MKKICIVGSINMDYFTITDRIPVLGETLLGSDFRSLPGGKGANQAIAAARLGGDVSFIGALGKDEIADLQIKNFKDNNVKTEGLVFCDKTSGIAQITSCGGDNSIIVVPGANHEVSPAVLDEKIELIKESDIIVLQLELPIETVEYAIKLAHKYSKTVILNPAPWTPLSQEALDLVDYITPNEIEAAQIYGDNLEASLKTYANKLIVTQGAEGVMFHDGEELINVPSIKTDVVDSTGAGDTFNGALAYALSTGKDLEDAILFANQIASMAISKLGAQEAMPTLEDYKKHFNQ